MAYPVTFDVEAPEEFDKAQVALRVLIVIALAVLQIGSIVFSAAYLVLPVMAAVLVSQKGAEQYLAESETGATKWLRYLLAFYSYMALATDKLPTESAERVVKLQVQPNGEPTVGSALIRIILAIPHAFVLGLFSFVFAIVWIVAAVSIVINGSYPEWAASFIKGYLRWIARLMAYMASLVDEYPPFSFENGGDAAPPETPAFGLGAEAPPSEPGPGGRPPTEPPAGKGGGAPTSEGTG